MAPLYLVEIYMYVCRACRTCVSKQEVMRARSNESLYFYTGTAAFSLRPTVRVFL